MPRKEKNCLLGQRWISSKQKKRRRLKTEPCGIRMEKVILVDIEPGYHDFPCSSSGFEPWKAMFQFSRGIPFFSVLLSRHYEYCLKFSLCASHEAIFFIIRERQYGLLLQCLKVVFHLAKEKVLLNLPILSSRGLLTWFTLLTWDSSLGQKDTKPKVYTLPNSILWITLIYDFCFDVLVFVVYIW